VRVASDRLGLITLNNLADVVARKQYSNQIPQPHQSFPTRNIPHRLRTDRCDRPCPIHIELRIRRVLVPLPCPSYRELTGNYGD
jgi:hypothetical protein